MAGLTVEDTDRHFENPFRDYAPNDRATLVDADGELHDQWKEKLLSAIAKLLPVLERGVDREVDHSDNSVYTGTCGVAMLYTLLSQNVDDPNGQFSERAEELVSEALTRLKHRKFSFLCGDAGPLALGAVLFNDKRPDEAKKCVNKLERLAKEVVTSPGIPDELLFGRAGYLQGLLHVRQGLEGPIIADESVDRITSTIVESGRRMSTLEKSPSPLMYIWHDSYYLGAAHGLAGIFFTLMRTPGFSSSSESGKLVQDSVDYLIALRFHSGNYPSSLGSSAKKDRLVHWCHGAPGFIHMFVQAFKVFGDQRYRQEAIQCGNCIWKRGLLRKGYGLCHGVAGNGYAFVALYQLTGDLKWLHRALMFAQWIFDYGQHGCGTADRPYSLFEGLAGTIYYLVDLLKPNQAKFPAFY